MLGDDRLGRYRLLKRLHIGGVAEVWRATVAHSGELVAVKKLRADLIGTEPARALFEREAATLAVLAHPNIVAVLDRGEDRGVPFFVMPFVAATLADELAVGRLPLERAASIIAQVASALDHAHAAGVIHGDIKPANVLFGADGSILLADFGVPSGGGAGTPGYQAPERAEGHGDRRADVFGLGALLHALLTGAPPPAMSAMPWHRRPTLRSVRQIDPVVPPGVERALAKALDPRPECRQDTARELADEVIQAMEGPAMPPTSQPPTRYLPRRTPIWQQFGLVLVGALVAGLIALARDSEERPGGVSTVPPVSATLPVPPTAVAPAASSPTVPVSAPPPGLPIVVMPPTASSPARPAVTPTVPPVSPALVEDLGLSIHNQPRPSPPPAGANQILVAHGDVMGTGTCFIRTFAAGEPVDRLGAGTFQMLRITGTPEQRQRELDRIAAGLNASQPCPIIASPPGVAVTPGAAPRCEMAQAAVYPADGGAAPRNIAAGDPTAVLHLDYSPDDGVPSASYILPPRRAETWRGVGTVWRADAVTCAGFDFVADATRYAGERQSAGHSGVVIDLRSGSPVVAANVAKLPQSDIDRLLSRHRAGQTVVGAAGQPERLAYYETGTKGMQTWSLQIPAGTTLIYGGYAVGGVAGGVYGAIGGPTEVALTVRDGFAVLVPEGRGREEYCFRIAQARHNGWAAATQRPLPGWTPCAGVSGRSRSVD